MALKGIALCVFLLLFTHCRSEVEVTAPDYPLFIGDKAKFLCSAPAADFEQNFEWNFQNEQDQIVVASVGDDRNGTTEDGKVYRTSSIEIRNASKINCIGTLKSGETQTASKQLKINDVSPLSPFEEECDSVEDPKIVLWRYSTKFGSRSWVPHVVTNASVELNEDVTHFILRCMSNTGIKWFLDTLTFKPSQRLRSSPCYVETLEINPISNQSSRKYICGGIDENKMAVLSIKLPKNTLPPLIHKILNDNETLDAIEAIVQVADNKSLYGVGFGSSAVSILMAVGLLFLKKTLARRREQQNSNA